MRKFLSISLAALLTLLPALGTAPAAPAQNSPLSRVGGKIYASAFANWRLVVGGNPTTATGSQTLTLVQGANGQCAPVNPDGTVVQNALVNPGGALFTPIVVGLGTANQETVTPTAVSNCSITASFSYVHGPGDIIMSGDAGINEAINSAPSAGGDVVVDGAAGATSANISAAVLTNPSVVIEDVRSGTPRFWTPHPTGAAIAAPTGIGVTGQAACDATHQACSDANVAGSASWGGTIYIADTCVDIMGNESPASATTNWTSVASKAIDLATPTCPSGSVGWVPDPSLSGGTYAQAYQITPTSLICTLTTLETVTPACAAKNTNYGQAASTFGANTLFNGGAQITGYPVNTSMHFPALGSTAMTAASQTPITNSSATYAYAPGDPVGQCNVSSANVPNYAAAGSSATTVPNAVATFTIPANCFNYVGAHFRVSGKFTYTDGGSGTSTTVKVAWDANGTDSTTVPTALCSILDTFTSVAGADNVNYSCDVQVATTGATGTALVNGISAGSIAAGQTTLVRTALDNAVAPSASINLTSPARIVVYFAATGATSNPGAQGLSATLESLN